MEPELQTVTEIVPIEVKEEAVEMSIAEGLASTDVAKIKAARGTAKGQVTKNVNILQDNLVVENDKFLYDEIDDKMVQEYSVTRCF